MPDIALRVENCLLRTATPRGGDREGKKHACGIMAVRFGQAKTDSALVRDSPSLRLVLAGSALMNGGGAGLGADPDRQLT